MWILKSQMSNIPFVQCFAISKCFSCLRAIIFGLSRASPIHYFQFLMLFSHSTTTTLGLYIFIKSVFCAKRAYNSVYDSPVAHTHTPHVHSRTQLHKLSVGTKLATDYHTIIIHSINSISLSCVYLVCVCANDSQTNAFPSIQLFVFILFVVLVSAYVRLWMPDCRFRL